MVRKCCFAGHSEIYDIGVEEKIQNVVTKLIEKYDVEEFWVGNYGKYDKLASTVIRQLKKQYADIRLVLVVPYLTKEINENVSDYRSKFDEIIIADIPQSTPARFRILKANEFMVKECEFVVAYVKYTWGGAAKTLEYAERKHKTIINVGK